MVFKMLKMFKMTKVFKMLTLIQLGMESILNTLDAHPDPVGHGVGAGASEVPVDDDNGHQDTEQADNVIVLFL